MEKIDITTLDKQTLITERAELTDKMYGLPAVFEVNGYRFSWEKAYSGALRVISSYFDLTLGVEGNIKSYSFRCESGDADSASNTVQYFQTAVEILGAEFRQRVVQDYLEKKPTLEKLEAELQEINRELDHRVMLEIDAEIAKQESARSCFEEIGAVWKRAGLKHFAYMVAKTTKSFIDFKVWRYNEESEKWESTTDTVGYKKEILYSNRRQDNLVPTGIIGLANYKPEV